MKVDDGKEGKDDDDSDWEPNPNEEEQLQKREAHILAAKKMKIVNDAGITIVKKGD